MRLPWSLSILLKETQHFSLGSAWRSRCYMVKEARGQSMTGQLLRLRSRLLPGGDFWIRFGTSDKRTLDEIIVRKIYESVCANVRGCRTVLDLGGNIGLAARYFLMKYPDCQVCSVEPFEENISLYHRNLAHVPPARFGLIKAAVWRTNELVRLMFTDDKTEYDAISVQAGATGPEVQGLTMTEVIKRSGFAHVDLLKVDIEGAEVELFTGDCSWLEKVRAIAIEFHGRTRQLSNFDEIVSRANFKVRDLNSHTTLAMRY